jgi:predicted amidohydrolase
LLTPEGSLSGYTPDFDQAALAAALAELTCLARTLRLGLALGTCFTEPDGRTHDQLRFYSPAGDYLGAHSKILLCGSLALLPQGEINHYASAPLRTFDFAGLPIGGLICNDLWANPTCTPMPDPHLSQQLVNLGARVIFHAVNGGRSGGGPAGVDWQYHAANLRLRAAAGKVWIVTVDNCAPLHLPCSAPGGVLNPDGEWVCRSAPQGEQLFFYDIELTPHPRAAALVSKLEKGLSKTLQALEALPPQGWQQPLYAEPPWRVRHLLAHLVSAEQQLLLLAQSVAGGGPGAPPGFDIDAFNAAEQARLADHPAQDLLERLKALRQQTIAWVQDLSAEQLERLGRHPALGQVTVETMLAAISGHHLLHLRDLHRLRMEGGPR